MWIKAQSGGLYKCIGVNPPESKSWAVDKNKPFAIAGVVATEYEPYLGWYATEERANQVLDAIQQFIYDSWIMRNDDRVGVFNPVFEMPPE